MIQIIVGVILLCQAAVAVGENRYPLSKIIVLKISSEDRSAVIRMPKGNMKVIHEGELLRPDDDVTLRGAKQQRQKHAGADRQHDALKVVEISKGRVVFEKKTDRSIDTIVISLQNGSQKIQRISRSGGDKRVLHIPMTEMVTGAGAVGGRK